MPYMSANAGMFIVRGSGTACVATLDCEKSGNTSRGMFFFCDGQYSSQQSGSIM